MILYLDTTRFEVALKLFNLEGKPCGDLFWTSAYNQSEELLAKIDGLLRENKANKNSLSGIIVNPGPGSFTGIRIGVTAANFLAYALDIPVLAASLTEAEGIAADLLSTILAQESFDHPVLPIYNQTPHITLKKGAGGTGR